MTAFYWHAEVGDKIVGSGWAKSISDAHNKAAQAISYAPDSVFPAPHHRATVDVTERKDD